MTIGVGGSTFEAELAKLTPMTDGSVANFRLAARWHKIGRDAFMG